MESPIVVMAMVVAAAIFITIYFSVAWFIMLPTTVAILVLFVIAHKYGW